MVIAPNNAATRFPSQRRHPDCTRWSAVLVVAALFTGGCEVEGPAPRTVVGDSAGVRIVENLGPSWGPTEGWRVSDTPTVEIGTVDGAAEYQFSSIVGLFRLRNGRMVVADRPTASIRIYDADGSFLGSFGGRGSGPGEFGALSIVFPYPGDSIAAWDARRQRLSVFDESGRLGRTARVTPDHGTPQGPALGISFRSQGRVLGAFSDGSLVVSPGLNVRGQPGTLVERDIELFRSSPDGEPYENLGRFPGAPVSIFNLDAMRQGKPPQMPIPFPRPFVTAIHGDRVYVGASRHYEIAVFSSSGSLEELIRTFHTDLTLDGSAREAFFDEQRRRLRDGEFGASATVTPAGLEQALGEVSFPQTLPPYSALLVDSLGYVWVLNYEDPTRSGPNRWSVFTPDGALLGEVETPVDFQVYQIGEEFVLGTWRDEFDVPYAQMYALRRR